MTAGVCFNYFGALVGGLVAGGIAGVVIAAIIVAGASVGGSAYAISHTVVSTEESRVINNPIYKNRTQGKDNVLSHRS